MIEPRTKYVERDWGRLAYQVMEGGSAGFVVFLHEITTHLDLALTDPSVGAAIGELGRDDLTAIFLQPRGIGLSDPVPRPPSVEEQAADVLAVMDAEGVRAGVLGSMYSMALPAALVAAQHPDRVTGLVLSDPILAGPRAARPGDGWTPEQIDAYVAAYEPVKANWGSGSWLPLWDTTMDTPLNMRLAGMLERCAASPEMASAFIDQIWLGLDGRDVLPQVRVPTRVLISPNHGVLPDSAIVAAAEAIPEAETVRLPAAELGDPLGKLWERVMRQLAEMAIGTDAKAGTPDRVLTTVLFTDVVGSTERLAEVGDSAWRAVLGDLERLTRREAAANGGRMVSSTGDGALCELPGPAAAVRTARAIADGAPVQVRAGIHTGECERRGDDLSGLAVHIGARVCAAAGTGEVLVSRTVHDLMAGSETPFASRGEHDLKGVPGRWELFAAGEEEAAGAPLDAPQPTAADRMVVSLARRAPGTMRAAGRLASAVQKRRLEQARHA